MKRFLLSILCCLLAVVNGYAEEVTDVLTLATTGMSGTTYSSWSGKTVNTDAVYAGQSAGGNQSIQLRSSNSNSGIISTTSGGKVKKITVIWNSNTTSGRTLDIYGKNSAYSSPTDLYKAATQGTKLGSIKYGTSTELTIDGDYEYIGLRSNNGAMYLTSISITWENGKSSGGEMQKPSMPTLLESQTFAGSMNVEISCATEGAKIYYTTDGSEPTEDSKEYTESFVITTTTTIKAIAVNEAGGSNIAIAEYTRVAATPTIHFDEATFAESVEVTITAANGTTAYYTLDGKIPTENSDECPKTLTLRADATLQVIAFDEDGYASPIVEQKFTLKTSGGSTGAAGTATLVENVSDIAIGDQVVIVAKNHNYALSTNQKENNRDQVKITKDKNNVQLNDDVQVLTLVAGTAENSFAFYTGSGYLYAASSSSNWLRTQYNNNKNSSWDITIDNNGSATIKCKGEYTRNWLRYNSNSSLFSCYTSGQNDVSIYKVNTASYEDFVLNVTAAGWSTLYLGYNVVIPEDVTCYVISGAANDKVQLKEVTGVLPANTAVIVEANKGEYTFTPTESTVDVTSNMKGTLKNQYVTEESFVLAIVDDEVGLYKAAMNGGVFLNNANKAYLPVSALPASAQNAKALKFDFGTTGVEGVKVETEGKKVIYDLSGRRVNDMTAPGFYIVNGKKVLVK